MFVAILVIIACAFTLYGLYKMSDAMKWNLERSRLCEQPSDEEINKKESTSRYYLIVKNCDYNIEWLVSCFYRSSVDSAVTTPGLTVVDCGSDDDTKRIVEVMSTKHEDLRIMSAEEFIAEHECVVSENLNLRPEEFETEHKSE